MIAIAMMPIRITMKPIWIMVIATVGVVSIIVAVSSTPHKHQGNYEHP